MDNSDAPRQDSSPGGDATTRGKRAPARLRLEMREGPHTANAQWSRRASGSDPWRMLHRFAELSTTDLMRLHGAGTAVVLRDRDGIFGARLDVDDTGSAALRFETDQGRDLYRQVFRERQLATSPSSLTNRVTAMEPSQEPQRRAAARTTPSDPDAANEASPELVAQVRASVLAYLDERDPPQTSEAMQRRDLDRRILERSSAQQLLSLDAPLERDDLAGLRAVLNDLQSAADNRVGRHTRPQQPDSTLAVTPPVKDRFTAVEHLWRTDYWMRDRPDRLGFTEAWLTLKTAEHSPTVLMGMVDRARELGWTRLHLEGSAEFRREAWVLASARGLQTVGYHPTVGDRAAAKAEQERLEQQPHAQQQRSQEHPTGQLQQQTSSRSDPRESQLDALVRKAMQDAKVPQRMRPRLRTLLLEEGRARLRDGAQWNIRIYDPTASRHRANPAEASRTRNVQRER